MISFKNKIQILKTLKTDDLDLTEVTKYLDLLKCKSLAGPVFDKILDTLTDIDTQMTAVNETVSDEDWQDIVSDYETPIEKPSYVFVRNNVKSFVAAYKALDKTIPELDLNVLFNSLSKVSLCRTSSLQFLFFSIALHKPNAVLYFLLEGINNDPCVYIPYFVSFVSRIRLDCSKAIERYITWVRSLRKTKSLIFIQATQGLIYLSCFKREYINKCSDIFDCVFSNNFCALMNPNVVEMFCSLSHYECKVFKSLENHTLYLFPFDKSILEPIHELYEEHYVEFQ